MRRNKMDAVMSGVKSLALPEVPRLDAESFNAVYEAYKEPVYRFARVLADNAGDAEDLFQETWLRAVRSRELPPGRGNLKAWLFTIAANLHRDRLRKKRIRRVFFLERARSMTEEAADADTGWDAGRFPTKDIAARADFRLCLRRAVSRLPARERQVFVLKDVEGHGHAEISRMLGLPEPTVRTLLHRAIKRLQRDLAAFDARGARDTAAEEKKR
jgi:RNA polymerase sigma-70 factor (ECF subfamily)